LSQGNVQSALQTFYSLLCDHYRHLSLYLRTLQWKQYLWSMNWIERGFFNALNDLAKLFVDSSKLPCTHFWSYFWIPCGNHMSEKSSVGETWTIHLAGKVWKYYFYNSMMLGMIEKSSSFRVKTRDGPWPDPSILLTCSK